MIGLAVASWLLASSAFSQTSTATIKAVDVYRSRVVTAARLKAEAGPELGVYLRLRAENKRNLQPRVDRARAALEAKVRAMGPFAFLRLSYQEYATATEKTGYLTVDVVDREDATARMPFFPPPTGHPSDPGGALEAWRRYEELGEGLERGRRVDVTQRPECLSFYCVWGAQTPELAAAEKVLAAAAKAHKDELRQALAGDADAKRRAAAMYALAYNPDGKTVVEAALAALRDPAEGVRGAAMQVLADIAVYHRSFFIDAGRVIPALDYPSVADRAKALAVIGALSGNPSYKTYLASRVTPHLLPLLELRQPANHDLAYTALLTLSQQSFGERDAQAWAQWTQVHSTPWQASPGVSAETP